MTVHLTTHRLILVPDPIPATPSSSSYAKVPGLQCHLRSVRQTEFYTGFMRSSAKITLTLGRPPSTDSTVDIGPDEGGSASWTCGVCGYANSPQGQDGPRQSKCGLCGVGYEMAKNISMPATRSSTPVPASRSSLNVERTSTVSKEDPTSSSIKEIACPACTFLNHPSLTSCEICSTILPKKQASIPIPATDAPAVESKAEEGQTDIVRLSFRRGGEKEAYRRLKNVLSDKVWERVATSARLDRGSTANGRDSPRPGAGIGQ